MQLLPDNVAGTAMRISALNNRAEAEDALLNASGRVYVLLDGARFGNVHRFIYERIEHPEYRALYRGTFFEPITDVSPCLVDVSNDRGPMLSWYFEEGADKSQGIVMASDFDLRELSSHLQNFLEAGLPTKRIVLFRFYDPEVFTAIAQFPKKKIVSAFLHPLDLVIWQRKNQFFKIALLLENNSHDNMVVKRINKIDDEFIFKINDQLYCAFTNIAKERYISKKTKEFALSFPEKYTQVGEEGIRTFFCLSLEKSEHYNMQADRELNGLQTLMQYLGCDFDTDPLYPWARFKCFPDKDPIARIQEPESFVHLTKIYTKFLNFFDETRGKSLIHLEAALQRTKNITFNALRQPRGEKEIMDALRITYPQRYERVPESGIAEIMRRASHKAAESFLDPNIGTIIFTFLSFFCGVNFDKDPLCARLLKNLSADFVPGLQKEQQLLNHLHHVVDEQLELIRKARGGTHR
jgi:hypothetical protein